MTKPTPSELRRAITSTAGKDRPPKGWEPRLDVEEGVICYTSEDAVENHDWETIVQYFGFDPDLFTIDPTTLRASAWEQYTREGVGRVLHAYKAQILIRSVPLPEFSCVHQRIARVKQQRQTDITDPDSTFVFVTSDVQIGKVDSYTADGGHASEWRRRGARSPCRIAAHL